MLESTEMSWRLFEMSNRRSFRVIWAIFHWGEKKVSSSLWSTFFYSYAPSLSCFIWLTHSLSHHTKQCLLALAEKTSVDFLTITLILFKHPKLIHTFPHRNCETLSIDRCRSNQLEPTKHRSHYFVNALNIIFKWKSLTKLFSLMLVRRSPSTNGATCGKFNSENNLYFSFFNVKAFSSIQPHEPNTRNSHSPW